MRNIQKAVLGTVFALTATLPALADYSQFDVKGTLDNSISVQVFDSAGTLFSGNDNTTTIPAIQFGKVNTSGQIDPANIGTGIGGVPVNASAAFVNNGSSGSLAVPGINPPAGSNVIGGLFAIQAPGGSIRVQVDSMASASSNLSVSYTTMAGTPPDLVLANPNVSLTGGAFPPASGVAIIQAGSSNILIAGTGGSTGGAVSSSPIANGPASRLGMNIGVLAFNAAGGGTLTDGSFTGRVKFTATP